MFAVKMKFKEENKDLVSTIKEQLDSKCSISILDSHKLSGSSSEIIIAIVAATPGIVTTIATTIQNYLKNNDGKTVTIENESGKRSYTGYSVEQIKELEEFLLKDKIEADE